MHNWIIIDMCKNILYLVGLCMYMCTYKMSFFLCSGRTMKYSFFKREGVLLVPFQWSLAKNAINNSRSRLQKIRIHMEWIWNFSGIDDHEKWTEMFFDPVYLSHHVNKKSLETFIIPPSPWTISLTTANQSINVSHHDSSDMSW
jgi:hypothetical protein